MASARVQIYASNLSELPQLLLIADEFTDHRVAARVADAVRAGVTWVQLRDHAAPDASFASVARELVDELRKQEPGIIISVNRRLNVAVELKAGFHTGAGGPSTERAAEAIQDQPVGYSAHSLEQVRQAGREGAGYVIFSPIFQTRSKPRAEPAGLDALAEACAADCDLPVIALGGITPANAGECLRAGAHGVAVLSGIVRAGDVDLATRAYLTALAEVSTRFKVQNPKSRLE